VVREDEVGRQLGANGGRVQLDVAVALLLRQLGQELCLDALVAVEHEHRQDATDLGSHVSGTPEVVQLGVRLLREHDDLMPGAAPFARERARVDVRPGPAEQVPVPEDNLHAASLTKPEPRGLSLPLSLCLSLCLTPGGGTDRAR